MPSKPKPSARERLVVWVGENSSYLSNRAAVCCGVVVDRAFLRLLRAYERELAERAVNSTQDAGPAECARIRAAILVPQATGRRGKR